MRAQQLYKFLMRRVRKIGIAIFFTGKGEEKTVGKALRQTFGAIVDAPFKATHDV